MMLCFLRLAGLTNFISKRDFSHFFSIGPDGILFSSNSALLSAYPAGHHGKRHGGKSRKNDDCNDARNRTHALGVIHRDPAKRLAGAPDAMVKMQAQRAHRDNVEK